MMRSAASAPSANSRSHIWLCAAPFAEKAVGATSAGIFVQSLHRPLLPAAGRWLNPGLLEDLARPRRDVVVFLFIDVLLWFAWVSRRWPLRVPTVAGSFPGLFGTLATLLASWVSAGWRLSPAWTCGRWLRTLRRNTLIWIRAVQFQKKCQADRR